VRAASPVESSAARLAARTERRHTRDPVREVRCVDFFAGTIGCSSSTSGGLLRQQHRWSGRRGVCRAWWQFFSKKKRMGYRGGFVARGDDGIAKGKNMRGWCSAGTTRG
jgi:hypothetical protein